MPNRIVKVTRGTMLPDGMAGLVEQPGITKAQVDAVVAATNSGRDPPAMIRDEQRMHIEYRVLGKADRKLMGNQASIFRKARWTGRKWKLGERVLAQSW